MSKFKKNKNVFDKKISLKRKQERVLKRKRNKQIYPPKLKIETLRKLKRVKTKRISDTGNDTSFTRITYTYTKEDFR